jgi:hypothetical protein
VSEYLEKRVEALVKAGRLTDAQVDRAVAKGLVRQSKAAAIKAKKPKAKP